MSPGETFPEFQRSFGDLSQKLEALPKSMILRAGLMQRSLTLTPPPTATLSCSPSESLVSSSGEQAIFPSFSWSGTHRSVLLSRSPMALRAGWRHSRCIRSSAAESNGR